jgi:hypothetical protein
MSVQKSFRAQSTRCGAGEMVSIEASAFEASLDKDRGDVQYHRAKHATPKIWTSVMDLFSASRRSESEICSGAVECVRCG